VNTRAATSAAAWRRVSPNVVTYIAQPDRAQEKRSVRLKATTGLPLRAVRGPITSAGVRSGSIRVRVVP
jgi:hypothetical protein